MQQIVILIFNVQLITLYPHLFTERNLVQCEIILVWEEEKLVFEGFKTLHVSHALHTFYRSNSISQSKKGYEAYAIISKQYKSNLIYRSEF